MKNFFLIKRINILLRLICYPLSTFVNFIFNKFNIFIIFRSGRNLGDNACVTGIIRELYNSDINIKIILFSRIPEFCYNNPYLKYNFNINLFYYLILKLFSGSNIVELNFNRYPYNSVHEFIKNEKKFQKKHLAYFISGKLSKRIKYDLFQNEFYFSKSEKKTYEKKFKNLGENFAIVNPHSKDSYTKVKGWGFNNFQETINKINIQWLQVGTNDEKNLENCINLNGKTNIRELLYLVYKAKFILCNEGYLNHLSSGFNKACFVIMSGFTTIEHVSYSNSIFIFRDPQIGCAPCYLTGECTNNQKYCTEDIRVDKVINIIINKSNAESKI